ncbi:hypothetical protein QJS10_CPA09g00726 [Acorus calamus]|uniref:RNase H type-1 domain-containing protein n=1 Tax=Acorus calamus TaxID=4465 RepID=A0AAV9E5M8_ACOCL|nr:hypothetical protein QJS10_CPA09g00726 [Acorus calamus]
MEVRLCKIFCFEERCGSTDLENIFVVKKSVEIGLRKTDIVILILIEYLEGRCGKERPSGQRCVLENSESPLAPRISLLFGVLFKDKPRVPIPVTWSPPPVGWIKANSDGSRSENRYGFGALIRNSDGHCVSATSARIRACSINLLELKGVVAGMKLAQRMGAQQIWSETDSTTAVAWAHGKGLIP